jgi:ArsR family transcriptional regulator, arsenate/arsenite/antimonite-responsive transcriptional repressor
MDARCATAIFDCLSPGLRLDLFRLLVSRERNGLVAGEISSALAVPPSNLSSHLKTLLHAGLISVEQEGRFQRFRTNIPLMRDVVAYLTSECCAGHPEQCAELRSEAPAANRRRSAQARQRRA